MTRPRRAALLSVLALGALGARAEPPPANELDVVIGLGTGSTVAVSDVEAIFRAERKNLADGTQLIAFNYPPDDPLRVAFDAAVMHQTQEQAGRFWIDQRVRGGPRPPRTVTDPQLAMRLVAKLPGAVAYVPHNLVDASVRVVARIRDGHLLPP